MKVSIPFLWLLGLVFVVLKLTNVIDWSWWWVTCPFWVELAFIIVAWVALKLWASIMGLYYKATNNKEYLELQKRMKELEERKNHGSFYERLKEMQEKQEQLLREKQENNNK